MPGYFKVIAGTLVFLLVILIVIAVFGVWLVKKSLPNYGDTLILPSLEQPVDVYWDMSRVPHIYARSSDDLFRAAGYIAAQERLWQMELSRRVVRGTLSELFGKRTFEQDKLSRIIGFRRLARRTAKQLSQRSLRALQAYGDGINDFIHANADALPVEFSFFGIKPEPWEITDSLGFIRLMGFQLSYAWHLELTLQAMAERFGVRRALELLPDYPADAPIIISEQRSPLQPALMHLVSSLRGFRSWLTGSAALPASNSWVVSGARSASGKPLLANDPHLGLTLPSLWFEMHLAGGGFNIFGVTLPPVPGVVIGQNPAAAWGMTTGMIDDMDFYIERINPENPNQYWRGNGWTDFQIIRERIDIRGEIDPVFLDVRLSSRGPIVTDIHPATAKGSTAVSFRWTGQQPSDEMLAFLMLNKAHSWQDFVAALQHFKTPGHNFVFADTSGTIGYYAAALVPLRRDGKGFLPYRGWERFGDWIGEIPFGKLPHVRNPREGFVVTANNRMTEDDPAYLGRGWEPPHRAARIRELLQPSVNFDTTAFKKFQNDLTNVQARKLVPLLLQTLSNQPIEKDEQKLLKLLENWNFIEAATSVPATLYNVLFARILENCVKDEMGDTLFQEFTSWSNLPIRAMESLLTHPHSAWWDDTATPERETRDEIVLRSFRETITGLQEKLGPGPGFWEWGKLHKVTFRHVLGERKPLDRLLNRGPYEIGGSANTIPKAEFQYHAPFAVKVGASMRQIVDLADPLHGLRIIAGGQSGQPFADTYADQIPLWLAGTYRTVSLDSAEVAAAAAYHQQLLPGKTQ